MSDYVARVPVSLISAENFRGCNILAGVMTLDLRNYSTSDLRCEGVWQWSSFHEELNTGSMCIWKTRPGIVKCRTGLAQPPISGASFFYLPYHLKMPILSIERLRESMSSASGAVVRQEYGYLSLALGKC